MTDEPGAVELTLADLRIRAGLTQDQVAEKMFVSRTQVRRIEGLYPELMFPTLRAYLDALGVDIKFILGSGGECLSGDVVADVNQPHLLRCRRADRTRRAFRGRAQND